MGAWLTVEEVMCLLRNLMESCSLILFSLARRIMCSQSYQGATGAGTEETV